MFANALGRFGPLRSLVIVLAVLLTAAAPAAAHSAQDATPAATSAPSDAACAQGTPADWTAQMDAYTAAGTYPAVQTQDGNAIRYVIAIGAAIVLIGAIIFSSRKTEGIAGATAPAAAAVSVGR